ncbi:MAG: phosphoglucosamine mutase [Cyanobacteriota bacterium]
MNNLAKTLFDTSQLPQTPLFGTDGIRGKAGDILNAPFALQLGYWAGKVLEQAADRRGPIIVGQDSRNSSDMLAYVLPLVWLI